MTAAYRGCIGRDGLIQALDNNIVALRGFMRLLLTVVAAAALGGCASGYKTFYTPVAGATPQAIASTRAGPPPVTPAVERSPTIPDPSLYGRRGYAAIGYSSYNSGRAESEAGAIKQGAAVGADLVVLINPQYTGSTTSEIPITTPTSETAYSTGSATAYGASGSVTAYGSATTTTYGSTTTYVPITVNRYDYGAVYFVKQRYSFGANWRDLTDEERAALQSNRGVYVLSIVNDTPAFHGDFLAGDIITHINGEPIAGSSGASALIATNRGRQAEFTLVRNGELLHKTVRLAE